jgi:hypothetical protein
MNDNNIQCIREKREREERERSERDEDLLSHHSDKWLPQRQMVAVLELYSRRTLSPESPGPDASQSANCEAQNDNTNNRTPKPHRQRPTRNDHTGHGQAIPHYDYRGVTEG